MNDNIILEFLDAYKKLDRLCKNLFMSEKGISEYITRIEIEDCEHMDAACWEDYQQLKKLRWIRNQLVHDINSFHINIVSTKDVEWLNHFYNRIREGTDAYSMLTCTKKKETKKTSKWLFVAYCIILLEIFALIYLYLK